MKLANCLGNMGQRSEHTTSFPSSTCEFIKHGSLSVQIQMDLKGRQLSISESHFVGAGNLSGKITTPYRLWTLHHQAFNVLHFVVFLILSQHSGHIGHRYLIVLMGKICREFSTATSPAMTHTSTWKLSCF